MGRNSRNSGIELLRVVAMVLIVFNHSPFSAFQSSSYSHFRMSGAIIATILGGLGGVGDILFFGITAWYMTMETPDLRRSLRRVWMLEKQLLFTSFALFAVFLALRMSGLYAPLMSHMDIMKILFRTLFPVVGTMWWYPTSYAIFCFLHPWLQLGLQSLGRRNHLGLLVVILAVWGITPISTLGMTWSIVLFVYLYVIFSFIRWYASDSISPRTACNMLFIGAGITVLGLFFSGVVWSLLGITAKTTYFNSPRSISTLMVGIGLIMIQDRSHLKSKFVNGLASTMFASYLILTYSLMGSALSSAFGSILSGHSTVVFVGATVVFPFCFIAASSIVDIVRQLLFNVTVNRKPGAWFDSLWSWIATFELLDRVESCIDRPIDIRSDI